MITRKRILYWGGRGGVYSNVHLFLFLYARYKSSKEMGDNSGDKQPPIMMSSGEPSSLVTNNDASTSSQPNANTQPSSNNENTLQQPTSANDYRKSYETSSSENTAVERAGHYGTFGEANAGQVNVNCM